MSAQAAKGRNFQEEGEDGIDAAEEEGSGKTRESGHQPETSGPSSQHGTKEALVREKWGKKHMYIVHGFILLLPKLHCVHVQ